MDFRVSAFIQFYAREGQAAHVVAVAGEVLKRAQAPAPVLALWRAWGLLAGGSGAEVRKLLARRHPRHPASPLARAHSRFASSLATATQHFFRAPPPDHADAHAAARV